LLNATTAIGIALGSVLAGYLSRSRFRASLVRIAAVGMVLCMGALAIPGEKIPPTITNPQEAITIVSLDGTVRSAESNDWDSSANHHLRLPFVSLTGAGLLLMGAGLFAGLFSVPLQVYIQAMAPEHLKGRMIGAMNLINWIGIAFSGAFYEIGKQVLVRLGASPNAIFGAIAVVILIAAGLFRMQDESLEAADG
jgi:acyl-[acyl-carrier-protein]-phospholipid O-acyltransferase/long-chain-fatty-acid--[acyl-carrier-protein] ligase